MLEIRPIDLKRIARGMTGRERFLDVLATLGAIALALLTVGLVLLAVAR